MLGSRADSFVGIGGRRTGGTASRLFDQSRDAGTRDAPCRRLASRAIVRLPGPPRQHGLPPPITDGTSLLMWPRRSGQDASGFGPSAIKAESPSAEVRREAAMAACPVR